jgi:polysaccharide biosynthesis protein PelF
VSNGTILLTTEGTYPCFSGGVSHWCDQLIRRLPQYEFDVFAVGSSPHQRPIYQFPRNLRNYMMLPLWGTEEAGWQDPVVSAAVQRKLPEGAAPEAKFMEAFARTVSAILTPSTPPGEMAEGLCGLHRYFRVHDYAQTMSSRAVWETFRTLMIQQFPNGDSLTLAEITDCMRWLLRTLAITSVPLGDVSVVHASMAGLAGVPGVLHKRLRGVPFVITEHGIYLRELYIVLSKLPQLKACRRFLLMLADAIVRMNYEHADVVTSLCEFNRKWQQRVGCNRPTVTTPNGADPEVFRPSEDGEPDTPVILTLARIFRLKGVDVLLKAVPKVCAAIPGVKVRILGDVADEVYFEECMDIVRANRLEAVVEFGKTSRPADALRQATVACLPSISEAFPFALVEAMLCGCPIVAADVGGIAEVLGETGLIFGSRDHDDLASALIFMLDQSPEGAARRRGYGEAARARALANYTMAGAIGRFETIYNSAIRGGEPGALKLIEARCTSGASA